MTITNSDNIIDSRGIIARIEELQGIKDELEEAYKEAKTNNSERPYPWSAKHEKAARLDHYDKIGELQLPVVQAEIDALEALKGWEQSDDAEELKALEALAEEGENSPEWNYGEALIHEDYFTDYIEELISDCYELPKELTSGEWPYRHITIDYEAAAEEAKQDYIELDFDGQTYLIRA